MNKKGIQISLNFLIGVLLAAILIIGSLVLFTGFFDTFFSKRPTLSSMNSVDYLKYVLENIDNFNFPPSKTSYSCKLELNVHPNFCIVYFEKGSYLKTKSPCVNREASRSLKRCPKPNDYGCICLCDEDLKCDETQYCRPVNVSKEVTSTYYEKDLSRDKTLRNFVIYGEYCDGGFTPNWLNKDRFYVIITKTKAGGILIKDAIHIGAKERIEKEINSMPDCTELLPLKFKPVED